LFGEAALGANAGFAVARKRGEPGVPRESGALQP
jgi:hypothetical protein